MKLHAITWNVFHGRDWPPEPELQVRRGRLSRKPVRGEQYAQVNRNLFDEFSALLSPVDWDVALLQEVPPRWASGLERTCEAESHRVLTSRNWLLPITRRIGRWKPDLLGSSAGGSNVTLVRPGAGRIDERTSVTITRRPERRVMSLTRLESGVWIANLHVSTGWKAAERDLLTAAERASGIARADPLLFGGDLNVRPRDTDVYAELAERFGLAPPTAPERLSHLLVRGLEVVEHPAAWPPEARDVKDEETGLKIRLADHNPVEGVFARVR
ncbi:MAG: endonuclease/exonuclease/phosphatase family protein [Solirubrobacterales bacterium]